MIDEGIDTGPILYQRRTEFGPEERTFAATYKRLIRELEALFVDNIDDMVTVHFSAIPQKEKGTYHRTSDLPKEFAGWDSVIQDEIARLRRLMNR
jgi:methionyl-tRNA formyltransferase